MLDKPFSWKKKIKEFCFLLGITITIIACNPKPYYKDKTLKQNLQNSYNTEPPLHTFYLVGDAGKGNDSSVVFMLLKKFLSQETSFNFTTLFLGDNIYKYGLPDKNSVGYEEARTRLDAQINAVKPFQGKVIFIPGNHDWALDGKDGWNAVKRQQQYVESALGEGSFLPKQGCPGPEIAILNERFVLITYDSQWWIHKQEKPDSTLCTYGSERLFLEAMRNTLEQYKDRTIIVAGHHPFFSCSSHGGRFTIKEHLFPLRFLNSNLYIPLPGIGSGLVLLRYWVKHPSDSWNPRYKALKKALLAIFENYPHLIYVSGHDHNLQYRKNNQLHHIISGSGTKISEVGKSPKWEFTYSHYGLAILKIYNHKTDLEFWVTDKKLPQGKLVYKKTIIP